MTDKASATETKATDDTATDAVPSRDIRTVELDVPVLCGNREVSTLVLRRPNSGALRGLSLVDIANMDVTSLQRLLPRITEPALTSAEVAALDLADLTSIGVEVAGFFGEEGGPAGIPVTVEEAMADLAVVFHWQPKDLYELGVSELMEWRERARKRWEPDD